MPRPLIGPKVDFRVPPEVQEEICSWADDDGIPHDAMFRELLISGVTRERERRETPARAVRALSRKAGSA